MSERDKCQAHDSDNPISERVDEVIADYLDAVRAGTQPDPNEWLGRHPELADELASFFADRARFDQVALPLKDDVTLAPRQSVLPVSVGTLQALGDYELLEEIARGGMGVVYKARQISLNRIVALKMILAGQLAGAEEVQRFLREAQTAANLRHPHIVPIHEVGEHNGQYYFSMDYVDGQSLADRIRDQPLPPTEAVRLLIPVARAIHYAHQQGTLHRDLKPSNVLIDSFGRPLVTDFGLAKQMTLSKDQQHNPLTATGAVLGTPSYMPPEQASGDHGVMGPASDVYSLGAVLYELVTGRPPFRAATAFDTLLQVLEAQPAPARVLNPAINRDLETILLRCLEKEPGRRYASAEDLAQDLDAFVEGRPIKARRPGILERSGGWVWRHRSRFFQGALVAVISVVLAMVGWEVLSRQLRAQLGRVQFNGEPGLSAEIKDAISGQIVTPRFALPREDPIALPEGDYLVHLTGPRAMSATAQLRAIRGDLQQVSVGVRPRWETPTPDWRERHKLVNFGDRQGIVGVDSSPMHLYRVDAFAPWKAPVWDIHIPQELIQQGLKPFGYTKEILQVLQADNGRFLGTPADLDEDGVRDLLWTGWPNRGDTLPYVGLLAFSGQTGKLLWSREVVPTAPEVFKNVPYRFTCGNPELSTPVAANVDGKPLVVVGVHVLYGEFRPEGKNDPKDFVNLGPRRWVHAVSGKTGETAWRYPLENALFPKEEDKLIGPLLITVPAKGAERNDKPYLVCVAGTRLIILDPRTGRPTCPPIDLGDRLAFLPRLVESGTEEPPLLLCQLEGRLAGFRFPDGKPAWPTRELGFKPLWESQVLDPAGPVVLVLKQQDGETIKLSSRDLLANKTVWTKSLQASWSRKEGANPLSGLIPEEMRSKEKNEPHPAWPLVSERDKDGKAKVLVPGHDPASEWAWVEMLDADTGAVFWQKRWKSNSTESLRQPDQMIFGPDLDGDGHREVFVVSFARKYQRTTADQRSVYWHHLCVHALSGKDGRILWVWDQPVRQSADARIGSLVWWQTGADGWPQLVVPYVDNGKEGSRVTYILSAATGGLVHEVEGLTAPQVADLDGDGRPDLYQLETFNHSSWDGHRWSDRVTAYHGERASAWQRLGSWMPKADLDSDGITDLVGVSGKHLLAISGKDGHVLWQADQAPGNFGVPQPFAELAGTKVPDLIGEMDPYADHFNPSAWKRFAISGQTGRTLWLAGDADPAKRPDPLRAGAQGVLVYHPELSNPQCYDLLGDGQGILLYAYVAQHRGKEGEQGEPATAEGVPNNAGELANVIGDALQPDRNELCLAAVAGRDGSLLWRQVFASQFNNNLQGKCGELRFQAADLDGDGIKEVICFFRSPDGKCALQVREGRDGSLRWQLPLEAPIPEQDGSDVPLIITAGFEESSGSTIHLVERIRDRPPGQADGRVGWRVRALGGDGKARWTWQSAWFKSGINKPDCWTLAVAARLEGIGPALCLSMGQEVSGGNGQATLIVLDRQGHVRQQIERTFQQTWSVGLFPGVLHAADLDGGGEQALVWRLCNEDLMVTRGGFDPARLLWKDAKFKWMNGLAKLGPGRPDLLRRNTLLLDARTGQQVVDFTGHSILPVAKDAGLGRLVDGSGSVCTFVPPRTADGKELLVWGEPRIYPEEMPDPRLAVVFPWAQDRKYEEVVIAALCSLVWFALPLLCMGLALYWRSYGWGLAAVVVIGVASLAWVQEWVAAKPHLSTTVATMEELWEEIDVLVNQGNLERYGPTFGWLTPMFKYLVYPQDTRFFRIAFGLPLAVWTLTLAWCLGQRRWGRLGILLGVTILSSLVVAGVDLWQATMLDPAEYRIWDEWYLLFLPGAYTAGLLVLLFGVVLGVVRVTRWLRPSRGR